MKSKSLKLKLISLTIGIVVLLGACSFGVLRYVIFTQREARTNQFKLNAISLSDAVSAQFFERYGDVQAFALNPDIKSAKRQTIVDALNTYAVLYGIYDLIMVVNAKGKLVAVNDKGPDAKSLNVENLYKENYSETPWFKAVMNEQYTEDKAKNFSGTFIEDPQIDPWTSLVAGGEFFGSSFSTAVKSTEGRTIGVISNRAGSRWFEVAFKDIFMQLKEDGLPHTQFLMSNKNGGLLLDFSSKTFDPEKNKLTLNWKNLLAKNLSDLTPVSAAKLKEGLTGINEVYVSENSQTLIEGFSPVKGPKFIESLGWGIVVRDDEYEVFAPLIKAERIFYLFFSIVLAASVIISYFFSTAISKTLSQIARNLSQGSQEVSSAAAAISEASTELSETTSQQAAAIQETAASIDEVSSMVKKSADNAAQSQKASQESRGAAESGQAAIEDMIKAINEISSSNANIMRQVEDGNQQFAEILKVISEIGNKTKVINDIVFQTKLLSFNASVEAARAGEHGKGFAVVAEEVGNLAQMSGNSAKEISSMLESSIQKVNDIINSSKSKIESMIMEGKQRVDTGITVAGRCGEALGKILGSVRDVDGMVAEISSASQEQAQGVSEINKAINQMDKVTQQNAIVASRSAASAEQLNKQSQDLQSIVSNLQLVVTGDSKMSLPAQQPSRTKAKASVTKTNAASERSAGAKVVKLKPANQSSSPSRKEPEKPTSRPPVKLAQAVGESIPLKDDPRFEDI